MAFPRGASLGTRERPLLRRADLGARGLREWLRPAGPRRDEERRGRSFPLTPELRALLEQQREPTAEMEKATGRIIPWVFWRVKGTGVGEDGQQTRAFYKAWRSECK